MGKILELALRSDVMNHAWNFMKKDRGLWRRGLPLAEMQRDVIRHVGELGEAVRNGSYRPEAMRCFEVDKADGGKRTLCASVVRDKLLQRALLLAAEPLGEAIFHPWSYGYRPQCSVQMAVARLREFVREGYHWLGDADIKSCFDSIPQRAALRAFDRLCKDRDATRLVGQWLSAMPREFLPFGPGIGLPQGMVLSPFLCNLYLHEMDLELQRKGVPFVRFADDFVVLGRSEAAAQKALKMAERRLEKLSLRLHPEKTRVVRSSPRYRFLGERMPDANKGQRRVSLLQRVFA